MYRLGEIAAKGDNIERFLLGRQVVFTAIFIADIILLFFTMP